jgi:hypothetical protein
MICASMRIDIGRDSSLVGRLDFKSSKGRQSVLGGFDSHSLPPPFPLFWLGSMVLPDFLDQLRSAAEEMERQESEYRRESRRRLEGLAAERTRAYRRYNLLKDMAAAAAVHAASQEGIEAQLAVAAGEAGWSEARAGYTELRERLSPVAALIHERVHPPETAGTATAAASDIPGALAGFEAWYRERFGQDFLDLLGRPSPSFQPLVDF